MVELINVYKSFNGVSVISDFSLKLNEGKTVALVGRNGAGKTTLIRLISGLLKPDKGSIVFSQKYRVGVLLGGSSNLYSNLTGREILYYFGRLSKMSKDKIDARISELDGIFDFFFLL